MQEGDTAQASVLLGVLGVDSEEEEAGQWVESAPPTRCPGCTAWHPIPPSRESQVGVFGACRCLAGAAPVRPSCQPYY